MKKTEGNLRMVSVNDLIEADRCASMRCMPGYAVFSEELASQKAFAVPCITGVLTVIACREGSLCLEVNNRSLTVGRSEVAVLIYNDQVRIVDNCTARGFQISVVPELFNMVGLDASRRAAVLRCIRENPVRRLDEREFRLLMHYPPLLTACMEEADNEVLDGVLKAMYNFLTGIYLRKDPDDAARAAGSVRAGEIFRQFVVLLKENDGSVRTLDYYAGKLGMSPNYLSRMVREYSGRLPVEWIRCHVVMRAMTLLRYSRRSVKEVGFMLGFPSQAAFSKFFRHNTGKSPSEYRSDGNLR